jgi:hypothetical protein
MPGLIRGVARTAAIAGTATAVSNRVSRRQANRWAAEEAQSAPPSQYYASPPPAPAAPPSHAGDQDVLERLERLGALRDSGVLTEEEFVAQKARILGR